jgi:hypothetical protein
MMNRKIPWQAISLAWVAIWFAPALQAKTLRSPPPIEIINPGTSGSFFKWVEISYDLPDKFKIKIPISQDKIDDDLDIEDEYNFNPLLNINKNKVPPIIGP